jgi:MraZ protein
MNAPLKATYVDTFAHAFDDKGRVSFPSEWRGVPYEAVLFVFPSETGCLRLYPQTWMSELQSRALDRSTDAALRAKIRSLARLAQRVELDAQGRIKVKPELKAQAGIGREVVLAGGIDHVELWDAKRFKSAQGKAATIESVDPDGEIFV